MKGVWVCSNENALSAGSQQQRQSQTLSLAPAVLTQTWRWHFNMSDRPSALYIFYKQQQSHRGVHGIDIPPSTHTLSIYTGFTLLQVRF